VVWGAIACTVVLAAVQKISLDFPLWLTLVSVFLSLILMLVGIRVLGETNWAPISAMANVMQAVFAALAPGHIPINMIGSGMSGTVAANGEHLMQDYRAGKIVGSTNRNLTILQLIGVPVGALAVAIAYPLVGQSTGWAVRAGSPLRSASSGRASPSSSPRASARCPPAPCRRSSSRWCSGSSSRCWRHAEDRCLGAFAHRRWPRHADPRLRRSADRARRGDPGGVAKGEPQDRRRLQHPLASGFITGEALVLLVLAAAASFK